MEWVEEGEQETKFKKKVQRVGRRLNDQASPRHPCLGPQ